MRTKQSLSHLSLIWILLSIIFAVGLVSTSLAETDGPPIQNERSFMEGTPGAAAYAAPLIQVTPAYTVNLPIVIKQPPPTSTPTPTLTPTSTVEVTPNPSVCNPSNGSGGLSSGNHITTVAGLKASVVVSDNYDPQKPTYLSFHIHGDGGVWRTFGEKPNHSVTQFVNEQGWILVVPESPNGGDSWWRDENGDHRQAFADVLAEMFSRYNLCQNTIIGSSGSGGSEFWTRMFFPRYGQDYPTHILIGCGGNDANGEDRQRVMQLGSDPDIVSRTTLHFLYGSEDYLLPLIEDSIDMYQEAGFNVIVDKLEGAGHCNEWSDGGFPKFREQTVLKWDQFANTLGLE